MSNARYAAVVPMHHVPAGSRPAGPVRHDARHGGGTPQAPARSSVPRPAAGNDPARRDGRLFAAADRQAPGGDHGSPRASADPGYPDGGAGGAGWAPGQVDAAATDDGRDPQEYVDAWWVPLRVDVVRRMRWMNTHHAQHAWDQRVRDPLSAHALALFAYDWGDGGVKLCTGTRLFLRDDAPAVLPRLLHQFRRQVVACRQQGHHPYERLTDRRDPLSRNASFLGVGVSSLDSRWRTWEETQRTASSVLDVPGRCLAVLNDGTMMVIDRGADSECEQFLVRSTSELGGNPMDLGSGWRWVADVSGLLAGRPPLAAADYDDVADALALLGDLGRVLGEDGP